MTTWKFSRQKDRSLLASFAYRIFKVLPFSRRLKFRLSSQLAWIFRRIAFENGGGLYAIDNYEIFNSKIDFIKTEIGLNDFILDLGCADGVITKRLSLFANHIVGVDYNSALISNAINSHRNENTDFVCGEALNYLSSMKVNFNIMICSHILEHLDEPEKILKDYISFFEKIFIEVPDNDQDEHSHMRVACGLKPLYNDADHIWEFRKNDMLQIFNNLNLKIISSEYCYGVMRFWLQCPKDELHP